MAVSLAVFDTRCVSPYANIRFYGWMSLVVGSNASLRIDAMNGNLARMRVSHERGATDIDGALYWAAWNGQLEAMRLAHDEWGATHVSQALKSAAMSGSLDAMHLLHDEWGATLTEGIEEITDSEDARRLLEQWAHPRVKSALKK